jgi:hypothetical protein
MGPLRVVHEEAHLNLIHLDLKALFEFLYWESNRDLGLHRLPFPGSKLDGHLDREAVLVIRL